MNRSERKTGHKKNRKNIRIDPADKILRFILNTFVYASIVGIAILVSDIAKDGKVSSFSEFGVVEWGVWVIQCFVLGQLLGYSCRSFVDVNYKPYRWNIVGRLLHKMAMKAWASKVKGSWRNKGTHLIKWAHTTVAGYLDKN